MGMQPRWELCHGALIRKELPLRPSQWVTLALHSDVMPLPDEAVPGPGQLCGAPGKLGISPSWSFCGLSRCTLPPGDGRDSLLKKKCVFVVCCEQSFT